MRFNEPTFNYPNSDPKEMQQAVTVDEPDKQQKIRKKTKKRKENAGSSLGWGWFQGFNLLVTVVFLLGFLIFAYFMMGGESRHDGPPKYALDESSGTGQVVFNPQIPLDIRKTFEYVPPVKNDIDEDQVVKVMEAQEQKELENQITLLSGRNLDRENEQMGEGITLYSSSDDNSGTPLAGEDAGMHKQDLLDQAEIAMSIGDFVGTENHDAYYLYQQVLQLDPHNVQAHNGVAEIAYIYYQNAERSFYEGNFQATDQYLSIGLIVNPNDSRLKDLRNELNQILSGQTEGLQPIPMHPQDYNYNQ